ncbi:MAG: NAD(P)/FAD-dependent oxidoreductase, partial [Allosphingosinicella sp.]
MTKIVIVGGGVAGLELARRLGAKYGRLRHNIVLIERNPTHIWKPLLHEVAAGSLDANLDELDYRSHCHRWGYRFALGTLEALDRQSQTIRIAPLLDDDGSLLVEAHSITYDYLVLAIGSVTNDFGTPGVRENCLFLDDRVQADRFRLKLLNHCLRVSRMTIRHPGSDQRVHVAIVGGGATGVELAAELFNAASALRRYGLEEFNESRLEVTLIEAGPRILPALPEKLADAARCELEGLGVRVLTGTKVTEVTPEAILTEDGGRIDAELRVWAAGIKGSATLENIGGLETTRNCQLVVQPTLQTSRDDRIFAVGDCSFLRPDPAGRPVPPRAQAAHQMATTVFTNLVRSMEDRPLKPFLYKDHGSLVSLSRFSTVGSLMGSLIGGRMAIEGRLARLVYRSLYRMHL